MDILRGIGWLLGKIVMIFLAIVFIGPYEGAKWLYKRVYNDSLDYIGFSLFGLIGSIYGAISGYNLAHGFGYGMLASGVAGFISFLLAAGYATPILWMIFLRPVVKMFEKLWKAINNFARKNFEGVALGLVELARALPGADSGWSKLLAPERKASFFQKVLEVLTYPSAVAASAWAGYVSYNWVAAFGAGIPLVAGVATGAGAVVGVLIFALLADVVCKWLHYGKLPALGLTVSVAAIVGGAPVVASYLGLSLVTTLIATAVGIVLFTAYAFPWFVLLFSDRLLAWVRDTLKPLVESVYDEKETGSRHLFQQGTNIALTAGAGWGAAWLCSAIALPPIATVASVVVVVALAYTVFGKVLDWDGGNVVIGALLALGTGAAAGFGWHNAGFIYGNWGAVISGVLAALPVFFLIFPLVYAGYRWVANLPGVTVVTGGLGGALHSGHDRVWKRFDKLVDRCQKVYRFAYNDERPYDKLVLHVTNLLATGAAGFGLHFLLTGFAITHPWLALTATAAGTAITYIAGGQYLVKAGLELVGAITSLIAAVALGSLVVGAQPLGYGFAVPFGFVVAALTYLIVYPLAFIGVRYVADPLFTGWLLPILSGIHSWCWNTFFTVFKAVRDFLAPIFKFLFGWLLPVWMWVVGLFVGALKLAQDAWNSMFGRK
jgi:hypothetical protein